MAKVSGPLLSIEARGSIAESIVFFPWKGRHLVRQWLTPANPKKADQGYVRVILKCIGKAIARITSKSQVGDTIDSYLYTRVKAKTDPTQPWNATFAKQFLEDMKYAGKVVQSSFDNVITAFSDHTASSDFVDIAASLNLADFKFDYGYTDNIEDGFMLYAAAYAAQKMNIEGFTKALADWLATDITQFGEAYTATTYGA